MCCCNRYILELFTTIARMYDTFSRLINVITIAKLYPGSSLLNMTYTFKFYPEILCCTKDFFGKDRTKYTRIWIHREFVVIDVNYLKNNKTAFDSFFVKLWLIFFSNENCHLGSGSFLCFVLSNADEQHSDFQYLLLQYQT